MKRIEVNLSALKETKPHEYAVRFLFGGLCTVLAGSIAKRFGPGVGGLFLAFPAIFPAGTSLIESHEKQRKAQIHADGTNRGRVAASLDSAGASLGCVGLLGFAFVLWKDSTPTTRRSWFSLPESRGYHFLTRYGVSVRADS